MDAYMRADDFEVSAKDGHLVIDFIENECYEDGVAGSCEVKVQREDAIKLVDKMLPLIEKLCATTQFSTAENMAIAEKLKTRYAQVLKRLVR